MGSLGNKRRNIPAYAGKTIASYSYYYPIPEHPRVCGENDRPHCSMGSHLGTSPRMRGKPDASPVLVGEERNIPAYAGKTTKALSISICRPEHPRVCGENLKAVAMVPFPAGTSPRMRGKHLLTCGSSFLKVILHSILFFCTVGGSMESPLQLPPF